MPATAEQSLRNRKTAALNAKTALGLTDVPASQWTYEQKTAYRQKLADIILAHPDSFTTEDLRVASEVLGRTSSPIAGLEDDSFSFTAFGDEFLEESKQGLYAAGSMLKTGFYIAVVAAVLWYGSPWVLAQFKKKKVFSK